MSTERDDSLVDNNAEVTDDLSSVGQVSALDLYGPAQRDQHEEGVRDVFADLSALRKLHVRQAEQSLAHENEMFDRRVRLADALSALVVQTVSAGNASTSTVDAALVDSLVGIIDKLTALVPPAQTGSSAAK
jgi:hypothetical protein